MGWLTGCISPRRLNDTRLETESTHCAMDDLHRHIGSRRGDLFVTDS